jgi:hypothetical protein
MAWEVPLVAGVPPVLLCAAPNTATNNKRLATPHALILRRVFILIGISF